MTRHEEGRGWNRRVRERVAAIRWAVDEADIHGAEVEALRWAAREARTRDGELDVIHAWHAPMIPVPPVVAVTRKLETLEARASALLDVLGSVSRQLLHHALCPVVVI